MRLAMSHCGHLSSEKVKGPFLKRFRSSLLEPPIRKHSGSCALLDLLIFIQKLIPVKRFVQIKKKGPLTELEDRQATSL